MDRETPNFPQRAAPALLLFGVGVLVTADALFGPSGQRALYLLYACIGFLMLAKGWGRYADGADLSPIETVWFGWTGMQSRRNVGTFLMGLVLVSLLGTAGLVRLLSFLAWDGPIRATLFMAQEQFLLLLFWFVLGLAGWLWMILMRLAGAEGALISEKRRKQITALLSLAFLVGLALVTRPHVEELLLGVGAVFVFVGVIFVLLLKMWR